ncbi:MAG: hypothetical protein FJ098_14545 [Deltaproteobacteria bacterium]|nr:hypothetical protein [Deltaproteobacteria bacterium]
MTHDVCPRCGAALETLEGEWCLLHGDDVPRFGSRAEILITPRRVLRVGARRCTAPGCVHLELVSAPTVSGPTPTPRG